MARLIVELRDRQGKSFPQIASELNQRGWTNRKGASWNKVGVRQVHQRWTGKL
ncbi:MAG: recombinase family protein [Deltaproteobacteria bacterium]|nr:recombinase family protein [Deltaproteobacteria bacterium]